MSGAKDRRPALDRLLADARRRRFDVLACTKLDRLARSVHHLTSLGRELEALGIDLVVLDQSIDTSTPAGRLLFHVLGSIAEFERDLIRERTAAGMRAAKRRGARIGRPEAAVDRLALVQGIRDGASIAELGRRLGVSRPTIRKLVSAEVEGSPPERRLGSDRESSDDLASLLASPAGRIEQLELEKTDPFLPVEAEPTSLHAKRLRESAAA